MRRHAPPQVTSTTAKDIDGLLAWPAGPGLRTLQYNVFQEGCVYHSVSSHLTGSALAYMQVNVGHWQWTWWVPLVTPTNHRLHTAPHTFPLTKIHLNEVMDPKLELCPYLFVHIVNLAIDLWTPTFQKRLTLPSYKSFGLTKVPTWNIKLQYGFKNGILPI